MKGRAGFSLVEVLVVLAVFTFLAAVVAPGYTGVRNKQVLNSMANRLVADMRDSGERARAQEQSNQWGIRFSNPTGSENDYYEIWYGTDYTSGVKVARIALSPGLKFTDPTDNASKDIIFSKTTGVPTASASVVISSTVLVPSHSAIVNITASGKIDFDVAVNLIGYWDFDEVSGTTSYDNSGQGNNGTNSPVVTPPTRLSGVNCKSGGCLSFNGTSQYVSAGNGSSLNVTSSFSAGAWLKTSTNNVYVIAKRNTDVDATIAYNLNIVATSGFGHFYVSNGTTNANVSGTTNLADGAWHHLMGVFNSGSNVQLYVDGVLQTSTATTITSVNTNTANFTIAAKSDGLSGFLNGTIDETRIYNRALSDSEITSLFNFNNK